MKNCNPDITPELISHQLKSLKECETIASTPLQSLFGAYKSDETADEIIEQIRVSKAFNRNTRIED